MTQMRTVHGEEIFDVEMGRELTENELAAICGGTGGTFTWPNWFAQPEHPKQGKAARLQEQKDRATADAAANNATKAVQQFVDGFNALTTLTNGLVGSLI